MTLSNKFILDRLKLRKLERKNTTLITTNGNLTQIISGLLKRDSDERYYHYSSLGKRRVHISKISECIHYKIEGKVYKGKIIFRPRNQ